MNKDYVRGTPISAKEALDEMRDQLRRDMGARDAPVEEMKDSDRDFFEAWDRYAARILRQ